MDEEKREREREKNFNISTKIILEDINKRSAMTSDKTYQVESKFTCA